MATDPVISEIYVLQDPRFDEIIEHEPHETCFSTYVDVVAELTSIAHGIPPEGVQKITTDLAINALREHTRIILISADDILTGTR
jgi:hypothetical protein